MDNLKSKKILVVDDEPDIRTMIDMLLRKEGYYRIYTASDSETAIAACRRDKPDIAILDVLLPDQDGFALLTAIRQFSSMPALFLSARGEDEDRLLGLGLGADDYIVKPFLPRELILRLNGILKRVYQTHQEESLPTFQLEGCTVDLESAVVYREADGDRDREQPLTAKEYAIIMKLYENRGRIVTTDALFQAGWGDDGTSYENTLMVHIRRIREKIEADPSNPCSLLTVRGLGYKLMVKEP